MKNIDFYKKIFLVTICSTTFLYNSSKCTLKDDLEVHLSSIINHTLNEQFHNAENQLTHTKEFHNLSKDDSIEDLQLKLHLFIIHDIESLLFSIIQNTKKIRNSESTLNAKDLQNRLSDKEIIPFLVYDRILHTTFHRICNLQKILLPLFPITTSQLDCLISKLKTKIILFKLNETDSHYYYEIKINIWRRIFFNKHNFLFAEETQNLFDQTIDGKTKQSELIIAIQSLKKFFLDLLKDENITLKNRWKYTDVFKIWLKILSENED